MTEQGKKRECDTAPNSPYSDELFENRAVALLTHYEYSAPRTADVNTGQF